MHARVTPTPRLCPGGTSDIRRSKCSSAPRIAGEYPARPALFEQGDLTTLGAPPVQIRRNHRARSTQARSRPVYTELSELFQVYLPPLAPRRQQEPAAALHEAAGAMNQVARPEPGLLTR